MKTAEIKKSVYGNVWIFKISRCVTVWSCDLWWRNLSQIATFLLLKKGQACWAHVVQADRQRALWTVQWVPDVALEGPRLFGGLLFSFIPGFSLGINWCRLLGNGTNCVASESAFCKLIYSWQSPSRTSFFPSSHSYLKAPWEKRGRSDDAFLIVLAEFIELINTRLGFILFIFYLFCLVFAPRSIQRRLENNPRL